MAAEYDGEIKLGVTLSPKDVKKSADELSKTIENSISSSANKKLDSKTQGIQAQMSKAVTKAREYMDQMSKLENTTLPTEQFKELNKELTKAESVAERAAQKYQAAYSKMTATDEYKKLNQELTAYQSQINQAITKRDALLEKGASVKNPVVSSLNYDIDKLIEKYNEAEKAFEEMAVKYKTTDLNVVKEETLSRVEELRDKMNELRTSGQDSIPGSDSAVYDKAKNNLADVNNQMRILINRSGESTGQVKKIERRFANLTSVLGKLRTTLTRIRRQASKTFGHLLSHLKQTDKHSKHTDVNFKKLFRTILKYGLGVRSLYFLFRKLRTAVKEGINNLAQWNNANNRVNTALSELKSSMTYLKNAWAAAFAPIITYVAPILSRLIDMLARAANAIGAFFAALTGQKTFYKALKVQQQYAGALEDTGKAADELKEKLGSYDKLEVIQDDKNKGGAGGGIGDINDMFEDVPVDGALSDKLREWIERLKEAWANQDWREVGHIIAEGLNAAMLIVDDWINNTFRPLGVKWAGIIAEILNGVVEAFDWELLGKTVADGVNAVFDIVNTFLEKFDFLKFGQGIGTAISSWFTNIEWDLIGRTFGNKWNALIHTLQGIVQTTDWKTIGTSIYTAINSWFDTVDWHGIAETVSGGVNGIFTTLKEFITGTNWIEMAKTWATELSNIFNDIDWATVGEIIGQGISSIINFLANFISTLDWSAVGGAIGSSIGYAIRNIDWAGLIKGVGDLIIGLIEGLGSTIYHAFVALTDWDFAGIVDAEETEKRLNRIREAANKDWANLAIENFGTTMENLTVQVKTYAESILREISNMYTELEQTGKADYQLAQDLLNEYYSLNEQDPTSYNRRKQIVDYLIGKYPELKQFVSDENGLLTVQKDKIQEVIDKKLKELELKALEDSLVKAYQKRIEATDAVAQAEANLEKAMALKEQVYDKERYQLAMYLQNIQNGSTSTKDFTKAQELAAKYGKTLTEVLADETFSITYLTDQRQLATEAEKEAQRALEETVLANEAAEDSVVALSDIYKIMGETGLTYSEAIALHNKKIEDSTKTSTTESVKAVEGSNGKIYKNYETTFGGINDKYQQSNSKLSQMVDRHNAEMQSKSKQLTNNISADTNQMRNNMNSTYSRMQSDANSGFGGLRSRITSIMSDIRSQLSNSSDMSNVGSNIIDSMRRGMESAKDQLMRAAENMATNVTNKVRRVFDMHSPSKVFTEIGRFLDLGLIQGLEGEQDALLKKVHFLADTMTHQFSDAALDIPKIAAGEVMPSTEAFTTQMNKATMANDQQQGDTKDHPPIVLQLEGRTVAEVVWDEEEKRYKQYNGYQPRFA